MNSAENIRNAFKVVNKTYENINKMINSCKTIADEGNEYVVSVPKFLRWKSDAEVGGWLINDFIVLFQSKHDKELENGWRNGPIYVLDIDLDYGDTPKIYISKFQYKNMENWSNGCSPTNHWRFYWPIRNMDEFEGVKTDDYEIWTPKKGKESVADSSYWGIKRAVCYTEELTDINADNIQEKIFDRFLWLKDK
ncbi:hypothetical protein [Clostridium coskatii]|uniref:Uncharacterized protein n=1 Tax=Clostridium coskatii TaxID=1705578 RepID=A0A168MSF7_9CLOT|nr:hypothetical protein [Clostridium coskatii]OAA85103.1 hypothetical protein WX73_03275 [Clostridium coskatii]OBR90259.1 hypothetical protein CLCOS_40930 [Clostridium coskatii]